MTALIARALASGYTQKQIIDYFLRKFPQHKDAIQTALSMGFTPKQVLKYLDEGREGLNQEETGLTEHEQITKSERETKSNLNKGALALGSLALGAAAAPALSNAMPAIGSSLGLTPQPIATTPSPMPPIGPAMGQTVPQPAAPQSTVLPQTQPQSTVQPQIKPQLEKATSILDTLGLREKAEQLRHQGHSADLISPILAQSLKGEKRALANQMIREGQFSSMRELIENFLNEPSSFGKITLPESEQRKFKGILAEPEIGPMERMITKEKELGNLKVLENGQMVIQPDGEIGIVKGEDNQGLLIESNGKAKKFAKDELIESPLPEKDLADLYDDLIQGVERTTGEDVSRMVNFSGFDPNTRSIAFLPHAGGLYIYDDLTPEEIQEATNIMAKRKTTGENFIGAWKEGTKSPAGAAMSAFIRKLQASRGGKGNEYARKYETVYSALEPAILAAKKKKKKK